MIADFVVTRISVQFRSIQISVLFLYFSPCYHKVFRTGGTAVLYRDPFVSPNYLQVDTQNRAEYCNI